MKKLLQLKTMLLLCALIVGSGSVWADTSTLTFTAACGGSGTADDGASWTVTSDATESTYESRGIHYGTSSKAVSYLNLTTSDISGTITQIVVNASGASGTSAKLNVTVGGNAFGSEKSLTSSATNYTLTGSASGEIIVSLTQSSAKKALFVKSIVVTYTLDDPTTVATPEFTPAAGTYDAAQSVEISCDTDDATIYYTTDGSTPTTSSSVYSSAISVTETTTIKAFAVKADMDDSEVATAEYILKAKTPTFSVTEGTYNETQSVEISCATAGATIYYTTNGSTPTTSSSVYSSAISVTETTTIKAIAVKASLENSEVATAGYTLKVKTPTLTPVTGTYSEAQSVEISCATDDATIYYTTDGSTPTTSSSVYSSAISVSETTTIKTIAAKTNWTNSEVASATYTIFLVSPKNINSNYFVKVTDESQLEDGDAILIVNEGDNCAMSTKQNTNNRAETSVSITSDYIFNPSVNVQKLVLVKEDDYYYFYTGALGYLYAASSSANHLKTKETPDNNTKAEISIDEGNAAITFQGNYSHNLMRYNRNNGDGLFSCYGSVTQDPVQIYKEVVPASIPMTITSAGYASFSFNYEVTIPDGVTAYYAQQKDESTISLKPIDGGYIPANTGVVISGDANTYTANVTSTSASLGETNLLHPWLTAGEPEEGTYYTLAVEGGNPVFKQSLGGTLAAGKAYLVLPAGARELSVVFDNEFTGIEMIENATSNKENCTFFNLAGQRVAQPAKGLYIMDGKKYVVK